MCGERCISRHSKPVVDTTCAGDTFTGFYLSALLRAPPALLGRPCRFVQHSAQAQSVPTWEEVVTEERKETDDSGTFDMDGVR
ncbi:MAG: hypothetical protein ACLVJ6_08740 [Merdibacter sp.]